MLRSRLAFVFLLAWTSLAVSQALPGDLFHLARVGDGAEVRAAIEAGADPNSQNEYGSTPLMFAAGAGNVEGVEALLAAGADPNRTGLDGWTAAMYAADAGHAHIVDLLVASGATPPTTPAAEPPIVDDPEPVDDRATAEPVDDAPNDLFQAARDGTAEQVSAFVAAGADLDARDEWGQTPLMYAAGAANLDTVRALISAGADVNARSLARWTALMYAGAHATDRSIVARLIRAGADVAARNDQGQTAVEVANPVGAAAITDVVRELEEIAQAREERERAAAEANRRAAEAEANRQQLESEARALGASIARALDEPASELVKLVGAGSGSRVPRWTNGIQAPADDVLWLAAWFETNSSRRIYLVHAPSGRYCRWAAAPNMRASNSEWMLVTQGLAPGYDAAVVVRIWSGGSLMPVSPTYASMGAGYCEVSGHNHQLH